MTTITVKTTLTFEHESGPEIDADTLLDAFAFDNGHRNGAGPKALRVRVPLDDEEEEAVYILKDVD